MVHMVHVGPFMWEISLSEIMALQLAHRANAMSLEEYEVAREFPQSSEAWGQLVMNTISS